MTTQRDVIKKFMAILDTTADKGETALNEAISAVTNFATYAKFRDKILSDCNTVNDAETFLRTYCGINLSNTDTGAIVGSDAGGTVTKTAESIVPEEGSLINFTGNSFIANGLTVKLGTGDADTGKIESELSFDDLNENDAYLWQALYTWWMTGGLDLIAESYGDNYGFSSESSAVTKTMWIVFSDFGTGTLAATWGGPGNAQKCTSELRIFINTKYYGSVTGKDGDPNNGQNYLDRTLAHELTHAVMRANIDYFDYLPGFIKEGMAEITHGIDDVRTSSIETLAGSSTKLAQALSLSAKTVSVSGVHAASYAGGYIFLRYLAHQNADLTVDNTTASTSLKTFAGDDTITNSASNVTIDAGTGDDSIVGGGTKNFYLWTGGADTIENFGATDTLSISGNFYRTVKGDDVLFTADDGSVLLTGAAKLSTLNVTGKEIADPNSDTLIVTNSTSSPVTINSAVQIVDASTRTKAVKITGNALDNQITGGSGNDTLNGSAGDDLLTGGSGNDIFIFGAGDDTVTDYGKGSDKISLGAAVKNFGSVGSDFVFDFGDDSLTLTDAASKKISVVGSTNVFTANSLSNSAGTAVTLSASTKNFTADSKLVTIDAGLTSNATIAGNSKANKISFGDGENVFVWTGGNDTLTNFAADDLISVKGAISDGSISGGNSVLKVGSNKITVKDSSQITFADSSGTKIFSGGAFTDEEKISATLTSATKDFDASKTTFTSITGNAKANKLTSNATGATLTGGKGNDTFVTAGGDDFITDYGNGSDKISLSSSLEDFSVAGDDVSLDLVSGSVTIANGAGKKISLVSGGKTTANIFTDGGIMNSAGTAVTLSASTKNFTADSKLVTIDAGLTSNATVTGNSKANKISFGDGENVFVWTGGNDTLTNFAADDLISVTGAISDGSVKSGNSYVKVGSNRITVKDSSTVTFEDNGGTKIFDGGIFFDADKTSVTLGSAVKDFDATDEISIVGNTKANKIHAGDFDSTIDGGKGNDSLWGGSGSDIFTYSKGDGKDVIYNFGSNDLLEIIGLNGAVTGKFNSAGTELTIKIGSTNVAVLKNFGATSTFNVTANGNAHQISK